MPSPTDILVTLGRRVLGPRQLNHLARFAPVLELVAASGPPGHLLDIGSGSDGISGLLPEGWSATAVDSNFDDYAGTTAPRQLAANQQLGDVRALPFADGSFPVTVALDLLEHVEPADREQAVGEICRVAERRAVIACPAGEPALAADRRLAQWFSASGRPVPGWLAEHLSNGFPEIDRLAAAASRFGTVRVLGNESIAAHERIVRAEHRIVAAVALRLLCRPVQWLMTSRQAGARRIAAGLLRRVRGHDRAPTYRAIVVVDRSFAGRSRSIRHSTE
jgi:hypothetical protein